MNKKDEMIFNSIKEEHEKNGEFWEKFQNDDMAVLTPEMSEFEDELLTRSFLIHYTEKYLELLSEVEKLKKATNKEQ